jgi:recombination protein RecA
MDKKATEQAVKNAISTIEKMYGKGTIQRLDSAEALNVKAVSTGILSIDRAIGVGGFPLGRIVEVYGPESGGKTTLCLHLIASVQKAGGRAAFIDAEHALDPVYAKALGVDTGALYVTQPDSGEQALEVAELLVKSGGFGIIVIDSVAALVPKAELECEMGTPQMGLQARLMSQACRKLVGTVSKSETCLVFINQIRQKIGIAYGNPEVTSGGIALKFAASVRIEVRRGQIQKDGEDKVGNLVKVKVVKNKVAPPFKEAEVEIVYGEGISRELDLLKLGVEHGVVKKSGAWYEAPPTKLGNGEDAARIFLKQNPNTAAAIEKQILARLAPKVAE